MEAARLRVLLHRRADVAEVAARAHLLDCQIEAFLRRLHQLGHARRDFTDRDGDRVVADETVQDRPEVEPDDVAFLQPGAVRDAVDDDVVDRGANDRRIRRQIHRRVALERRFRAAAGQLLLGHSIELRRGHPRLDQPAKEFQNLQDHVVGAVHHRDFIAALENGTLHPVEHQLRDFSIRSKTSSTGPIPSTSRNLLCDL